MAKRFLPMDWRAAALLVAVAVGFGLARTEGLAQSAGTPLFDQGRGGGGGDQGGRGGGRGGQTRDNQPQAIGTASIRGAVHSDDTGTPVRRARVTLTGTGLRGGRSTVTDDQGTFTFLAIPAGRFTMTASKPGFVNNSYGARSPGRPGTPIQLAENQTLEKAYISLPRGSVITGIVMDDHGEPAPGTQVRVMRFVMRSGERSLQQAGLDTADDRGMYRVYGLQPGEYMVSAIPRNQNQGDLRAAVLSEVQSLLGQASIGQAARGGVGVGGGGLGGFGALNAGGGNTEELIARAAELQAQLAAQDEEQNVAYAPVFYPGTTSASSATNVSLGIGMERSSVDFQLQLVPTARVEGTVMSPDGILPQGTQVTLVVTDRGGLPNLPGVNQNTARVNQEGQFSFQNVTPGQYSLQARATIREVDPNAQAQQLPGGRGARGGGGRGGAISQVLWAAMDVFVSGTTMDNLLLSLQPGMTVTGDVQFEGTTGQRPEDMTGIRVNLVPRGSQPFEIGGIPPAQVDEFGRFTVTGVAPGHYTIQAGVGGGRGGGRAGGRGAAGDGAVGVTGQNISAQWALQSARVNGIDALDFPFEVEPNQGVAVVSLTYSYRTQQVSGTLQDSSGRPTADYTIIVFPTDNRYWLPQSRRIASTRPDTDGRFTIRNLPPGDYRLTAITDAEPGEWYDPAFLSQLGPASVPFSLAPGQSFVQDIRLSGGHRP